MSHSTLRYNSIGHLDFDSSKVQHLMRNANLQKAIVAIDSSGLVVSATQAAKALGIQRPSRLPPNATYRYPGLDVLQVPDNKWGKPDTKSDRIWSFKIMKIVQDFARRKGGTITIEFNSLDDMFLDVSSLARKLCLQLACDGQPKISKLYKKMRIELESGTYDPAYIKSMMQNSSAWAKTETAHLVMGAIILQDLAKEILLKTGFKVSIGVAANKSLAKIATTLRRPRGINILTREALPRIREQVHVTKITGLGGKGGKSLLAEYGHDFTMDDLFYMDTRALAKHVGWEKAQKLKGIVQGYDNDPVIDKTMTNTLSCGKSLEQNNDRNYLRDELVNICEEMIERNFEEECIYHHRIGVRFKMEVESWFKHHQNYSYSFGLDPEEFNDMDEDELADVIMDGLKDDGFLFGRFYARKFTLTVTQFAPVPANWE